MPSGEILLIALNSQVLKASVYIEQKQFVFVPLKYSKVNIFLHNKLFLLNNISLIEALLNTIS